MLQFVRKFTPWHSPGISICQSVLKESGGSARTTDADHRGPNVIFFMVLLSVLVVNVIPCPKDAFWSRHKSRTAPGANTRVMRSNRAAKRGFSNAEVSECNARHFAGMLSNSTECRGQFVPSVDAHGQIDCYGTQVCRRKSIRLSASKSHVRRARR